MTLGWESSPNAVEMILHCTKDALNTLDDFKPAQSKGEQTRLYTMADRVIRGNANQQEPLRQRRDAAALGNHYSYRAGLRSSGEIPPIGQSLRGRMCLRKVRRGDIPKKWLDVAQKNARDGVYARVMSAFIKWLAPRMDTINLAKMEEYWRDNLSLQLNKDTYARTAANLAECYSGFALFVGFMVQSGVIYHGSAKELRKRCRIALVDVGTAQENYIKQEEPTDQFIEMLKGAIGGGFGFILDSEYEKNEAGFGGACMGYRNADKVWLIGRQAYRAAFEFAKRTGVDLGKEADLWAALADKGMITKEKSTRRNSVPRRVTTGTKSKQLRVREMDAKLLLEDDT